MKIIRIGIISIFIVLLFQRSISEQYSYPQIINEPLGNRNVRELKIIKSFPTTSDEEMGIYLYSPTCVECDNRNNVFIIDSKANRVFVFDFSGKYIEAFGQPGAGPGDFSSPTNIVIKNDTISVQDGGNMRFVYLKYPEKSLIRSIKYFHRVTDFDINDNGQIFTVSSPLNKKQKPIAILDSDGGLMSSFGSSLLKNEINAFLEWAMIALTSQNEIIQVYRSFPVIAKYSRDGELIKAIRITNRFLAKGETLNLEALEKSKERGNPSYGVVFGGVKISNGRIFILHYGEPAGIIELDCELQVVGHYILRVQDNELHYFQDLAVSWNGQDPLFFIIEGYPDCKAHKFSFQ